MVKVKFIEKEEVPIVWGKDDGVHYVTGTYKKDKPNEEIGYQKWEVIKTYEVEARYEIVAKTKEEAEELLERKETPTEEVDDYGDTFRETIQSKFTNDLSGDEIVFWKKKSASNLKMLMVMVKHLEKL